MSISGTKNQKNGHRSVNSFWYDKKWNSLLVQLWKWQLLSSSQWWVKLPPSRGRAACWRPVFTSPDVMNRFWRVVVLIKESWHGVVTLGQPLQGLSFTSFVCANWSTSLCMVFHFMHSKMPCHMFCSSPSLEVSHRGSNCSLLIVQFHYVKITSTCITTCSQMTSMP